MVSKKSRSITSVIPVGSSTDYFTGGSLGSNGLIITLGKALPANLRNVTVTYIPENSSGDRFSIIKDEFSNLNENLVTLCLNENCGWISNNNVDDLTDSECPICVLPVRTFLLLRPDEGLSPILVPHNQKGEAKPNWRPQNNNTIFRKFWGHHVANILKCIRLRV